MKHTHTHTSDVTVIFQFGSEGVAGKHHKTLNFLPDRVRRHIKLFVFYDGLTSSYSFCDSRPFRYLSHLALYVTIPSFPPYLLLFSSLSFIYLSSSSLFPFLLSPSLFILSLIL
uniref:Uncharacterized protein n=1 Tax=Cacopsylla melanoneura TaxID=428564 RepID=A0A8D9BR82_9HEMI